MRSSLSSTRGKPLVTRPKLRAPAVELYVTTLKALENARVPFVVGGAFAMRHYAGIARDTKDLDVFILRRDLDRTLDAIRASNLETELTFPHWLAKARASDEFVDIIYDSANGLCPVDDKWFETAPLGIVLGLPVRLLPVEELIWTKSFVMERERFDGADICHLIEACGHEIDWKHLLARYGPHWRILLGHLAFYTFVYPSARGSVPRWVLDDLTHRMKKEHHAEPIPVCRGSLLSREQYLVDMRERGYEDARTPPWGAVTPEAIALWTDAIGKPK